MKITIELNLLAELLTIASSAVLHAEGLIELEYPDRVAVALAKRVLDAEAEIACVADLASERQKAGERLILEGCGVKDV